MQLKNFLLAAAGLAVVAANTVEFHNQDNTERTIIFTANAPGEKIPDLVISGKGNGTANFPNGWIGNFFSISQGAQNKPGMLGEVAFNGWNGFTYFDVSAIVDPNDHQGVKMLIPKHHNEPISGCQTFPCDNAYNLWDDVQTKVTPDTDLICLIGNQ